MEILFEHIGEIITLICGLVSGGFIMNKFQAKRANVETENIVIEQMTKRLEQQQIHNDKLEQRCENLYEDVMVHRDEKIKLREEITKLKLQIQKERLFRCEKPCSKRTPPSEDATLNID